jgi:MFS transporter, DHA1 family, multidrug resistance protein
VIYPPSASLNPAATRSVSSAYFVGNTLGPLTGGLVAATVGIRFVFAVTAVLLLINLVWVWFTMPEAA